MWVVVVRVKRRRRPVRVRVLGPFVQRWEAAAVLGAPVAQHHDGEKWREATVVAVEPC